MPNYGLSSSWANGANYKEPFNYVLGVGEVDEAKADELESQGKQVVFIRRLDMGDLLKLGIAEELDFMSKELMTSDEKSEKASDALNNAILKASNFSQMERMINLVVVEGVIHPTLHMPPTSEAQKRQAGLVYADSIPFGDRMELFMQIFDTEGLSTFRTEQEAGVGDVEHEQSLQLPAERTMAEL
jgi:hypothetical protein